MSDTGQNEGTAQIGDTSTARTFHLSDHTSHPGGEETHLTSPEDRDASAINEKDTEVATPKVGTRPDGGWGAAAAAGHDPGEVGACAYESMKATHLETAGHPDDAIRKAASAPSNPEDAELTQRQDHSSALPETEASKSEPVEEQTSKTEPAGDLGAVNDNGSKSDTDKVQTEVRGSENPGEDAPEFEERKNHGEKAAAAAGAGGVAAAAGGAAFAYQKHNDQVKESLAKEASPTERPSIGEQPLDTGNAMAAEESKSAQPNNSEPQSSATPSDTAATKDDHAEEPSTAQESVATKAEPIVVAPTGGTEHRKPHGDKPRESENTQNTAGTEEEPRPKHFWQSQKKEEAAATAAGAGAAIAAEDKGHGQPKAEPQEPTAINPARDQQPKVEDSSQSSSVGQPSTNEDVATADSNRDQPPQGCTQRDVSPGDRTLSPEEHPENSPPSAISTSHAGEKPVHHAHFAADPIIDHNPDQTTERRSSTYQENLHLGAATGDLNDGADFHKRPSTTHNPMFVTRPL